MIIGHSLETNQPISIDLQRVLEGRLLIQANSGAGKSYCLRKFCEITHGKVQHILIDIEGEFASLREKFDYILVGKDGDIPINIRAAELLARRLLELNTSAIIDLYELKHHERKKFVRIFLEALINLPKELWHPCLVIIDECHIFGPESKSGEAESLDSVKDLATRGRKRGYALVACTQRISKLNKDIVAELNTKLIGRSSLDVDMKRSAFELGFTEKTDILSLRTLNKGEFYAFGPALTNEVTKIKIDKVISTHPEAGKTYQNIKSAPPEKVRQVLEKLKDLPVEAEEELRTKDDLKRRIIELQRELSSLKRQKPVEQKQVIDKNQLNRYYENGFNDAVKQMDQKIDQRLPNVVNILNEEIKMLEKIIMDLEPGLKKRVENLTYVLSSVLTLKIPEKIKTPDRIIPEKIPIENKIKLDEVISSEKEVLGAGPMKILNAIARFDPQPISIHQAGTIAGYSVGSGTWIQYISTLKKNQFITKSGKMLSLTEFGRELTRDVPPIPTDPQSLFNMWAEKLPAGPVKILKVLFDSYPNSIDRFQLSSDSGYAYGSGTWIQYISTLRKNNLIEVDGQNIKASNTLFPMGVIS